MMMMMCFMAMSITFFKLILLFFSFLGLVDMDRVV